MSISRINISSIDGRNHLHHLLDNQSDTGETSFKEILDKTTQHKVDGYLNDDAAGIKRPTYRYHK